MFQLDDFTLESRSCKSQSNERLVYLSCQVVENMYEKYANDLYMTSKIHHYISQQLPSLLENIQHTRIVNIQRNEDHSVEQERFTQKFLDSNRYYYNVSNELYFYYDGVSYKQIAEDEILHHIVSSISEDRNPMLMNWKHKTKVSILKKIKDRNILKNIPESNTIQTILEHLQQLICSSKAEAKLFLTVIGDNILKKSTTKIHYINPSIKHYLKCINNNSIMVFNVQCTQTFKYKYHEKHAENFDDCRLVPCTNSIPKPSWYESFLQKKGLDLLCIAVHYSHKYGSADEYISEYLADPQLQKYITMLKNKQPHYILDEFKKEYLLEHNGSGSEIEALSVSTSPQEGLFLQRQIKQEDTEKSLSWNEIQYLWKEYVKNNKFPHNLYQNMYKRILIEFFHDKYNPELDTFQNISSSQIPFIKKFLKFWDETIIDDNRSFAELEVEEISTLFRRWLTPSNNTSRKSKYFLSEIKILDVLSYFHPELEFGENKYVYNVRSLLWDKDLDIENAVNAFCEAQHIEDVHNCLDEAYIYYCRFYTMSTIQEERPIKTYLVSKSYFNKFILNNQKKA